MTKAQAIAAGRAGHAFFADMLEVADDKITESDLSAREDDNRSRRPRSGIVMARYVTPGHGAQTPAPRTFHCFPVWQRCG